MLKEKEKKVDVKVTDGDTEKTVTIIVRKPNNALVSQAQRVSAKTWTECVRDGIMTKKELEKFMKEHDIWNQDKEKEQKEITERINALEKELYLGSKGKRISKSEGKRIAIDMRIERIKLRELIAERMSLEQNTSESLSDNSRFDFLVANSTFYENGQRVYKDLDDYAENSDGEIGFAAATALAQMMYSIDKDFEAKLPENKFLKMFNFVDDLSLVNDSGENVDTEGRRIDKNGYYINDKGGRVDRDGNPLDENGNYILSVEFTDDDNAEEEVETKTASKKPRKKATDS
jgi:hypothetical protein